MPDDSSHNDDDSTWVQEDDDGSVIIDHDEQSNHHDHIENIGTVHARDNTIFWYEQHQTSIREMHLYWMTQTSY